MDSYSEAHLFVAAIRVLEHRYRRPPSLEEVCELTGMSTEAGHAVSRSLEKRGAIEVMEDPYSYKFVIADHLQLENIPRQQKEKNSLARELEAFQAKKKEAGKKASEIQAEMERKKRDMLSDIEAKFKEEMAKHKKK